jgi:hypothetical protein
MSDGIENTIGWGQGDTNNTIGWGQAQEAWCESSPAPTPAPVGATLMKTGQTTSYRTGDDGDLEAGRATNFFTLASNNPFGNTNRFTDELGGSTYTNDIVIDWSTYNGATVLGWRITDNGVDITWDDSIDNSLALSIGSFISGWRLPNVNEIMSIFSSYETNRFLSYPPFNNASNSWYWTSTTPVPSSTAPMAVGNQHANGLRARPKTTTSNSRYIPVRTFTVTGTTLT